MKKKNENRILYFDQSDSSELVKRKTNEGGRWSNQKTERIIYAEMRAVFELENTVEYTQHNNIVVHDNNNIILYRIVILYCYIVPAVDFRAVFVHRRPL